MVMIQSQARVKLARNQAYVKSVSKGVAIVQSYIRACSACKIQRAYRNYRLRKMGINSQKQTVAGVTQFQAALRGRKSRESTAAGMMSPESTSRSAAAAVPPIPPPRPPPANHESQRKPVASREIIDTSKAELLRYIQEENWSMVETMLDQNPDLAEEVDENTGELPLHIIARHSNAWTLLVDMILVLYPKALIHKDRMGAMPIHHASAHDNLPALEIIYAAYKEGINEVDYL